MNKIRENMMGKALADIQKMQKESSRVMQDKIFGFQKEAAIEREKDQEGKAANQQLLRSRARNTVWALRCLKCDSLACMSDEIRKVEQSHHVVLDDEFNSRIVKEPHPNPKAYDEFCKTHKVFCGKCKFDWGIVAIYKKIPVPVTKVSSFVLVDQNNKRTTCKKWKDVPFVVQELSPDDLQQLSASAVTDEDQGC